MRIFFASAENKDSYNKVLKPAGAKNVLMSYYYLKKVKHADLVAYLESVRKDVEYIFLDSGAHTFLAAAWAKTFSIKSKGKMPDPITYGDDYIEWLRNYAKYFDLIAELDIWRVKWVGYAQVEKWRKDMTSMGIKNKTLVVSHFKYFSEIFPTGWQEEWRRLCIEYPCLAIGDMPPEEVLEEHFAIWQDVGNMNRIHWFAETKFFKMAQFPYFSVDSTSWNAGSKYGMIMAYENGQMIQMRPDRADSVSVGKSKQDFLERFWAKLEPASQKFTIDDYFSYNKWPVRDLQNCRMFIAMEKDINSAWKERGIDFDTTLPKNLV